MTRKTRLTAILAKIETTYATDASPSGSADAILISNPTLSHTYNNQARDNIRSYLGANEELVGTRYVTIGFDAEIAGSGTQGVAPSLGRLLRACGMAETVTADEYVTYNPISTGFESLTIKYVRDGVVHTALGCMGNADFALEEGAIPKISFSFTGIDGGAATGSNPSQDLSDWQVPKVVTTANGASLKLGATYATGALSGGTAFCARGLMLNLGNDVQYSSMLGPCTGVDIVGRDASGSMQLDLDASGEVALYNAINTNALTSVGLVHGTTDGNKVLVFAPSVQRVNPQQQDFNGRIQISTDLRVLPVSGNDEFRIVFL